MNQTSLKHKSYSLWNGELTRTFESKKRIKIKITCHRVMENGYIVERISLVNSC